jgi:hypothetical protein
MVTIGTNYRSGSAIVATTQEADKMMRTVPWWPSVVTTTMRVNSAIVAIDSHHRQRHGGHRDDA